MSHLNFKPVWCFCKDSLLNSLVRDQMETAQPSETRQEALSCLVLFRLVFSFGRAVLICSVREISVWKPSHMIWSFLTIGIIRAYCKLWKRCGIHNVGATWENLEWQTIVTPASEEKLIVQAIMPVCRGTKRIVHLVSNPGVTCSKSYFWRVMNRWWKLAS